MVLFISLYLILVQAQGVSQSCKGFWEVTFEDSWMHFTACADEACHAFQVYVTVATELEKGV